ncbi:hypothetical protein K8942_05790 [Candidatus Peribacteria bacterium]|nr:MAG: hypothetical protein K8942_05790 [Candidatus Peribacteria bacterium]
MARYLHTLSATLFYILGLSFFVAYVLSYNDIAVLPSQTWMQIADLPLVASALLYGGVSVYRSLTHEREPSRSIALIIGVPLALIFVITTILSFWPTTFILNY